MKKLSMFLLSLVLLGTLASPVSAERKINIVVKTVLASQGAEFLDPGLSALIEELQSLFRYSSYRLLSEDHQDLGVKETGKVSLPGKRVLKITPTGVKGKRVELQLVIFKKKAQIFETVVQLLNQGSIIVGGPRHKDGSLLFNIYVSFQT